MAKFEIEAPNGQKFLIEGDGSPDEALAYFQENYKPPTAANAGAASFAANVLGTPATILKGLVNLPGMALGIPAAAMGRPDLAPNVVDVPGTGEFFKQKFTQLANKTGIEGLNPNAPRPGDATNTAAYDFASRGGFMPGSALPAAGSMVAEKLFGPEWGGVGALFPSAATKVYNDARAPGLAAEQQRNAVRDDTLKRARAEGMVTPPSVSNPGLVSNTLESVAGKAAVKQDANIRNSQVVENVVRRDIGLPENTPITVDALKGRRAEISVPYLEASKVSGNAKAYWDLYQQNREKSSLAWKEHDRSATRKSLEEAKYFDKQAGLYESRLAAETVKVGRPELMQQMRSSRAEMAKTYNVERALNLGDGSIDPGVLARAYDKGVPLTGGLETIAKFALSRDGKSVSRAVEGVGAPGVSALNTIGAGGMGGVAGYLSNLAGLGGPEAAMLGVGAAAAYPALRSGARNLVLSDVYQRNFGAPSYAPMMQPQGALQSFLQQAVLAQENK
jgi:hypothetical protein